MTLASGVDIAIANLKIGDQVWTLAPAADGSGRLVKALDSVYAFLHRDVGLKRAAYIELTYQALGLDLEAPQPQPKSHSQSHSGRLRISPAHLVFKVVDAGGAVRGQETYEAVYAQNLTAGDRVHLLLEPQLGAASKQNATMVRIVSVSTIEANGAFAPLTYGGTLVVDGVWASCYAYVSSHTLAHAAFALLRLPAHLGLLSTSSEQGADASLDPTGQRLWHPFARSLHYLLSPAVKLGVVSVSNPTFV